MVVNELPAKNRDGRIRALNSFCLQAVDRVFKAPLVARSHGRTVFVARNGGRASRAMPIATEFMLRTNLTKPPLRTLPGADSEAVIFATGNDHESKLFSRGNHSC